MTKSVRRGHAGGDGLADVHGALDDDAVHGRADLCVAEVAARALEADLRGRVGRARDRVRVLGLLELRVGHDLLLVQAARAVEVAPRLRELGFDALEARLGGTHLLEGQRRIDARDELARLHAVIEVHEDLRDLAGDLGADLDGLRRLERSGAGDDLDHVAALYLDEAVVALGALAAPDDEPEQQQGDDGCGDEPDLPVIRHLSCGRATVRGAGGAYGSWTPPARTSLKCTPAIGYDTCAKKSAGNRGVPGASSRRWQSARLSSPRPPARRAPVRPALPARCRRC